MKQYETIMWIKLSKREKSSSSEILFWGECWRQGWKYVTIWNNNENTVEQERTREGETRSQAQARFCFLGESRRQGWNYIIQYIVYNKNTVKQ